MNYQEIIIPCKPHVKDYLLHQYGNEPIRLPEDNVNMSILGWDLGYKVKHLPDAYSERLIILTNSGINQVDVVQVVKFNTFVEQQILHYIMFACTTRPTSRLSEVLMDVIATLNLDESKIRAFRFMVGYLKKKIAYKEFVSVVKEDHYGASNYK